MEVGGEHKLPAAGQRIRFRRKTHRDGKATGWQEGEGIVRCVWGMEAGEPVIDLESSHALFVQFGDTWEAADD